MAVTVGGTSITFNDATVQSTAAGAPTTAQVLNATAAAAAGAVGTYAFCMAPPFYSDVAVSNGYGTTIAGSSIYPTSAAVQLYSTDGGGTVSGFGLDSAAPLSGTWRVMGFPNSAPAPGNFYVRGASLFLRIS